MAGGGGQHLIVEQQEAERDRRARTGTVFNEAPQLLEALLRRLAGREHDLHDVVLHAVVHVDAVHELAGADDRIAVFGSFHTVSEVLRYRNTVKRRQQ